MKLAYCDYLAHTIQKNLKKNDIEGLVGSVGKVNFDIKEDGSYRSTKKTIELMDVHGKEYIITIEERRDDN